MAETTSPAWTLTKNEGVALLRFERPPENFVDFPSVIQLAALLQEFVENHEITVVMITEANGILINHADPVDLVRAGKGQLTPEENGAWGRALTLLEEIAQPTIAAIDGQASGGGNELALACTMRIGSARLKLQQPEVGVGIISGGGSVRLPRLVRTGVAADVIIGGRIYEADDAFRVGWINQVLPAENSEAHALGWAQAIAKQPSPALQAAKTSIVTGSRLPFSEARCREGRRRGRRARCSPRPPAGRSPPRRSWSRRGRKGQTAS